MKIQGCHFGGCLPEHSHTITIIIFSTAGDKNLGIPSWQVKIRRIHCMNQTAVKHWYTDLIFIHKLKLLSGTATRKDKVEPLFNEVPGD